MPTPLPPTSCPLASRASRCLPAGCVVLTGRMPTGLLRLQGHALPDGPATNPRFQQRHALPCAAVYMIGAAMPPECTRVILDAANGTTIKEAELPERFGWALQVGDSLGQGPRPEQRLGRRWVAPCPAGLQQCRLNPHPLAPTQHISAPHLTPAHTPHPRCNASSALDLISTPLLINPSATLQDCYRSSADLSEALRCLYALPMLGLLADPSGGAVADVGANHTAVQLLKTSTLPWLFGNATNGTALSTQGGRSSGVWIRGGPVVCAAALGLPQVPDRSCPMLPTRCAPTSGVNLQAGLQRRAACFGLCSISCNRARRRLSHGAHQRRQAALQGALHRCGRVRQWPGGTAYRRAALAGARPAVLVTAVQAGPSCSLVSVTLPFTPWCHAPWRSCSHVPTLVSNAARQSSWQYQAAVEYLQGEARPALLYWAPGGGGGARVPGRMPLQPGSAGMSAASENNGPGSSMRWAASLVAPRVS